VSQPRIPLNEEPTLAINRSESLKSSITQTS